MLTYTFTQEWIASLTNAGSIFLNLHFIRKYSNTTFSVQVFIYLFPPFKKYKYDKMSFTIHLNTASLPQRLLGGLSSDKEFLSSLVNRRGLTKGVSAALSKKGSKVARCGYSAGGTN